MLFHKNKKKISILGAGGWGSALALLLASNGYEPIIWTHETDTKKEINLNHTNSVYLPEIKLPNIIKSTNNPKDLDNSHYIILAIPTQYIRKTINEFKINLKNKSIINVAKGIEKENLLRVSEILNQSFDLPLSGYVILSGPSHAEEVARQMPTAVVAASDNHDLASEVQSILSNNFFRVYTSNDIVGCEIGGSLKNIIAIAAGIIDGLGLGDNTKAALITRGLAEITRLGIALGANAQTFSGLSGLGDLFVTCNSRHSRNRFVGEMLGKGKKISEILNDMQMVAEGVYTTESAYFLGKKHGVELPIAEQMYKILFQGCHPKEAITELMTRQNKREWWW